MPTKMCRKCGKSKPLAAFHRHSSYSDGHRSQCKDCVNPEAKQRSQKYYNDRKSDPSFLAARSAKVDPEKRRNWQLLRDFGISRDEYLDMVDAQHGLCGICGKRFNDRLFVDHNHDTGQIRGLLCRSCNSGIGMLGDSLETLLNAVKYLQGDMSYA